MKLQLLPFVFLFFCIGIICQYHILLDGCILLGVLCATLITSSFLHFISSGKKPLLFTVSIGCTFLLLGMNMLCWKDYIIRKPAQSFSLPSQKTWVELQVFDAQKTSNYYYKWKAEIDKIQQVDSLHSFSQPQQILLQLPKSSIVSKKLSYGSKVLAYGKLKPLPSKIHPVGFNYSLYLKTKGIKGIFTIDTLVHLTQEKSFYIQNFRGSLLEKIDKSALSMEAKETLKALTLAGRNEVSVSTQQLLSLSGIIHLFAISGLHIGILFTLFYALFKFFLGYKRRKISILISLFLLWLYGYAIGFPISVTRALLMLCTYYGFVLLKRPVLPFHSLALAGFIILLINPYELFSVGFQLSFMAVFSIFWLQKPLVNLLPFYKFSKYINGYISVTFSAQIGTLPWILYYFHQYSLLSFFLNLLLIPFAGILVIFSFITLFVIAVSNTSDWIINCYNTVIEGVFYIAQLSLHFEKLHSTKIPFSLPELIVAILIIIGLGLTLRKPTIRNFFRFLVLLFIFQVTRLWTTLQYNTEEELLVFNEYKNTIIGVKSQQKLTLYSMNPITKNFNTFAINPYLIDRQNPLYEKVNTPLKKLTINDFSVYVVQDSLPNTTIEKDVIILHHSPKIDWGKIKEIPCKKFIIDGSNYPSYIKEAKKNLDSITLENKVWITSEKGYYSVDL